MNKRVHLGLPILDLSKTVMYEFWYDYVKPKYGENAKLCHTLCEKCPNMELFLVHEVTIKNANIFVLIVSCLCIHQQKLLH